MDFKDLVQKRRSIRKFTDEPVSEEQLRTILRAALMAPTGHSQRGWHFVVIDDKEKLAALSQCREAGSAAITMQYQITDLGLGSCWCQVRLRSNAAGVSASQTIRQLLGLPDHIEVECVLGIGHPAIERKLQDEDKLNWDCVTR